MTTTTTQDPRAEVLVYLAGVQTEGYPMFDAARAILLHLPYREVDEFWRHITHEVEEAERIGDGQRDDTHPDLWSIPRSARAERADEIKKQMLADAARYSAEMVRRHDQATGSAA